MLFFAFIFPPGVRTFCFTTLPDSWEVDRTDQFAATHVIRKGNISSVRTHTFMELGDCILIKVDGDSVSVLES